MGSKQTKYLQCETKTPYMYTPETNLLKISARAKTGNQVKLLHVGKKYVYPGQ